MLLGKAPKLTRVICRNNPNLINCDLSQNTLLQHIDLSGCSKLGSGIGANSTMNIAECTNLKYINVYDTQLTAVYTNQSGGNIEEFYLPYSIQTVQVRNQPRLLNLGIPVYYTGRYTNPDNIFAENLVTINIANCERLESMVKNYYEVDGVPLPVPTFIGVSSCQTFNISNCLVNLDRIDLSYCARIKELSISDFYNLKEINFDDLCGWDEQYSNLSKISISNCPQVETFTFNQNTINGDDSLGVAFANGTVLDLSLLHSLKHIRSNVGVKGLKRLILPPSVTSLVFDYPKDTTYSQSTSDIEDIWSIEASHNHVNDSYHGMDLLGLDTITDFSMGSLSNMSNADNLNIKITNTFPYFNYFKTNDFFKPTGVVDISEYKGSLAYLFKGVDLDKLTILCSEQLAQEDASYMFAYASCSNVDAINKIFGYMTNITNLSYMFYNAYIEQAPQLPLTTTDCRYMFYNCGTMKSTPSNWNRSYHITPASNYCYTGCSGIVEIDGEDGSIDIIPVAWGGYDRENTAISGETIVVDNTLEREFVKFTANGQTLQNIVPEVGQTPTIVANKSEQLVGEGLSENILLADGEMPHAELEGFTLVNLASEKRSGYLTQLEPSQDIKKNLSETFKIEDEQEFHSTAIEGNSLVNIIPNSGETPLLSNSDGSYLIEKGLDAGIIVKNGAMNSAVVYGETMINLTSETIPTDETTVGYKQNFVPNDSVTLPTIATDGEFNSLVLEGNTLRNILPESGNTPVLSTDGLPFIETDRNLDSSFLIKDGEMHSAVLKGESVVDSSSINSVKSPTLIATNSNLAKISDGTATHNNVTITSSNNVITLSGNSTTYTMFDLNDYTNYGNNNDANVFSKLAEKRIIDYTGTLYFKGVLSIPANLNTSAGTKFSVHIRYDDTKDTNIQLYASGNGKDFVIDRTTTINVESHVNGFYLKKWYAGECTGYKVENIQLSPIENATYEPPKSTIIVTPKDLELRSEHLQQDTLDLNTGVVTRYVWYDSFMNLLNNSRANGIESVTDSGYFLQINLINYVEKYLGTGNGFYFNLQTYPDGKKYANGTLTGFKKSVNATTTGVGDDDVATFKVAGKYAYIYVPLEYLNGNNTYGGIKEYFADKNAEFMAAIDNPLTEQIDLSSQPKPYAYKNGYINLSSDGLTPTLDYQLPSSNVFEDVSELKTNTTYTLRYDGDVTSLVLGGKTINSPTSNMLVTSGSTDTNVTLNGTDIDNVMLFEGDVREQDINYFTGLQFCNINSISSGDFVINFPQPVQLNKLSDTVYDTYNVLTGEYIQRVGESVTEGVVTYYELDTPITTYLEPQNIYCDLDSEVTISTDTNTVFPKTTISMPTTNKYSTSMWNVNKPITHRNATEIYIDGSTTPTIPTETMTFTEEQLSNGSIVINDNGDGLVVLNGDYTGRDIPYFKGIRSVEGLEIVVTPMDQPMFGKGGKL